MDIAAEGVIVTFMVPGQTLMSVGKTDSTGKFQLTTSSKNDGAIEGENVVTVRMSSNEIYAIIERAKKSVE